MTFSIAIHGDPQSASLLSALGFIQAAVSLGHSVYRVFFYHDGVQIADKQAVNHETVRDLLALAEKEGFEITVCIAAATRRSVLNADSTASTPTNLQIVGLGQLADAVIQSDRFLTFAA